MKHKHRQTGMAEWALYICSSLLHNVGKLLHSVQLWFWHNSRISSSWPSCCIYCVHKMGRTVNFFNICLFVVTIMLKIVVKNASLLKLAGIKRKHMTWIQFNFKYKQKPFEHSLITYTCVFHNKQRPMYRTVPFMFLIALLTICNRWTRLKIVTIGFCLYCWYYQLLMVNIASPFYHPLIVHNQLPVGVSPQYVL